ncbi:MAG: zf-TFIIB domain-containing protein [Phycisphaerales bacterium]|nr:zf-TFIIB domain-containing protein [Phycisphaerales bacterium]
MDITPKGKIRCPKDATIMEKLGVGSGEHALEVDHCARCGAIWFDPYELEQTIKAKDAGASMEELDFGKAKHSYEQTMYRSGDKHCPRDNTVLIEIPDPRQPHVMIDLCRTCGGVLLDAGELKDLSEFTLAERVKGFFRRKA